MSERFRPVVKLIDRPRKQRHKVPEDAGEHDRIAESRKNTRSDASERDDPFPDHGCHGDRQAHVTQDVRDHHARRVCIEHPVRDISRRLHIPVCLKNVLEDQRICHEHSVNPRPGHGSHDIGYVKQLDPDLVLRLRHMDF